MLTNCVQYFYMWPLKFVMVRTSYGLYITNRENFVLESCTNVISHLEHLMPEHKVMILALSFNFLWYERSHATVVAVVDRFIRHFSKYSELNEEIQELLERYKVVDGIDDTLRERYVNKMDEGGDGSIPGLVGLCTSAIAKLRATLVPAIIKIEDNVVVKGYWKDLLCRRYFYRILDISLFGFKIVKNNSDKNGWVILDFNVDKVMYREYPKMLSYLSNVESGKKDYVDFDSEDSSSSVIEKKKKN